jgi:hypothetical protein
MKIQDIEIEGNKLTEDQLQALYIYLSMNYESMDENEKKAWYLIMEKIDKEFNDIEP